MSDSMVLEGKSSKQHGGCVLIESEIWLSIVALGSLCISTSLVDSQLGLRNGQFLTSIGRAFLSISLDFHTTGDTAISLTA